MFQNAEFHRTIEELTEWLDEKTSSIRSSEPVDLTIDKSELKSKHDKFLQLHSDLERCEPRIVSLQEAADQLELQMDNTQCQEVKAKLSLLSQKLRMLINVCHVYESRLSRVLNRDQDEALDEEDLVMPTLSNEVGIFRRSN